MVRGDIVDDPRMAAQSSRVFGCLSRGHDDFVERATVKHIEGYYLTVEEMDRHGNVKKMRKWVPGNAHAGMKWLSSRRPEVYREQKNVRHALSMDDAFLRFLDQLDEEQKLLKAERARVIEHMPDTGAADIRSVVTTEDAVVIQDDGEDDLPSR
jgi:hypothetical protein